MSIDLDFRPASYSDFDAPVAAAVNGIAGQMRRTMVRDMMTAEGEQRELYDALLGPVEDRILEERSTEDSVESLARRLGPNWLGGEYLPQLEGREVEIARVVLQSTLMDVFSIRARHSGGRYHYRIVDEYETVFRLCRDTSEQPLTLRQLIELMETVDANMMEFGRRGMVRAWWDQQRGHGYAPEECTAFAWVESELYPGLVAWYAQEAEAWRVGYRAELEQERG